MNYKENLLNKIASKTHTVGIIGLGYVGLPLALEFVSKNIKTIGFDIDDTKIPVLNSGKSYIKHIASDKIEKAVKSKLFEATSDFSRLPEVDAVIIAVPTPLNKHREPDLSYVESSAKITAQYLQRGQLVVLESSTYPGTTDEILLPLMEGASKTDNKYVVGEDFFLAFSPEREDPNNPNFNTATIPKVVGGLTQACLEVSCAVYDQIIVKTVPVSSPRAAEATKLLENIYRAINIALVNELKMVFDKMNIDVWEVIEAAKTKPFGFNAFYPGPGLGGHCIPIDPFYLTWKARQYDMNTKFIELAGEINTYQPYYVIERCADVLNQHGKALKESKVLILGAAYKKDIDDMRESPSLKLISLLRSKGAFVDYNDPYIPKLPPTRKYKYEMVSVELTPETLNKYDLVLLSTDHSVYDYRFIVTNSKLIVDTRNAFNDIGVDVRNVLKA
ncbi:MAG: UDP-N-acetyl-D-glucosamine 6-dehydrogenase [Ignavibacteriaceae bacterium]|nr:UDP-N-acetyl-D-glucosamine 6-dehydrogenase [Ignavibacteriaceae bacterium]